MANSASSASWDATWERVAVLRARLRRSRSQNVNDNDTRNFARQTAQDYFRKVLPEVTNLGLDTSIADALMQELLRLAASRSRRQSYIRVLGQLEQQRRVLEPERELRLSEIAVAHLEGHGQPRNADEAAILETLKKLLPSAALSYQQALADLVDDERVSFRGTAAELRETLREVLDYLAPDDTVTGSSGFAFEHGETKPTMRQKVRFILKSRGIAREASRAAEDSVSIVEEYKANVMRSSYERANISVHVSTARQEVKQLKRYADSVLCELLEIR